MTDSIETLVKAFDTERKAFQKRAQTLMKEAFTQFFNENPTISSITWEQYTPYFNDGDECTFSVHDMYAKVGTDIFEDRGWSAEGEEGCISGWSTDTPEEKAFKKFKSTIGMIPDDIFKETFGDHVAIIASRDGFDVEEYSHD